MAEPGTMDSHMMVPAGDAAAYSYAWRFKSVQGSVFKSLFEAMKEILHDCNLLVNPTGIYLTQVDQVSSVLVHMEMNAKRFQEFECHVNEMYVGVNMQQLFHHLHEMSSNDAIEMFMYKEDETTLHIRIENQPRNIRDILSYTTLALPPTMVHVPPIEYDQVITMPSVDLKNLCKRMKKNTEVVEIAVEDGSLKMRIQCENYTWERHIGSSKELIFNNSADTTFHGTFAITYISRLTKAASLCSTVELYLKNDFPLILAYNISDLGTVRFAIAQKVISKS